MLIIIAIAALVQASVQYSLDTAFANIVFNQVRRENALRTAILIVLGFTFLLASSTGVTFVWLLGYLKPSMYLAIVYKSLLIIAVADIYAIIKIRKFIHSNDLGPEWWRYQLATSDTITRWIWVVLTAAIGAILAGGVAGFYGSIAVLAGGLINDTLGGLPRPKWFRNYIKKHEPGLDLPGIHRKEQKFNMMLKIAAVWGHRDKWIEEYNALRDKDVIQYYWRLAKLRAPTELTKEAPRSKFTAAEIDARAQVIYDTEYKEKAEAEQLLTNEQRTNALKHLREFRKVRNEARKERFEKTGVSV